MELNEIKQICSQYKYVDIVGNNVFEPHKRITVNENNITLGPHRTWASENCSDIAYNKEENCFYRPYLLSYYLYN